MNEPITVRQWRYRRDEHGQWWSYQPQTPEYKWPALEWESVVLEAGYQVGLAAVPGWAKEKK